MADEEKKNEKRPAIVLSDDQFHTLIATLKAQAPQSPQAQGPMSPDQQVDAFVDAMKKGDNRPLHTIEEVPCKSAETNATFTAVVAISKTFPTGRVVELKDYTHPAGIDKHVDEGGLVPNGRAMFLKDGTPEKHYKQWRWENFYKADLQRYVGKDAAWLKRLNMMIAAADAETAAPPPAVSTASATR